MIVVWAIIEDERMRDRNAYLDSILVSRTTWGIAGTREKAFEIILNRINLKKKEGFEDENLWKVSENCVWRTPESFEDVDMHAITYYSDDKHEVSIGAFIYEVE